MECSILSYLLTFSAAFKFCLQYTRKAEFRKLCDNLRMHLGQIQRHHNQSTAINLNNPESQSMHLETRLVQLDSAISMELWQVRPSNTVLDNCTSILFFISCPHCSGTIMHKW